MDELRFPVGRFTWDAPLSAESRAAAIGDIAALPDRLAAALAGLQDAQLSTPYRPDGWTVRQVAHHIADSHLNGYTRLKLGLTEDNPTIKPYAEEKWAMLADSSLDPAVSLRLLDALHMRWMVLLQSMSDAEFERPIAHPEFGTKPLDRFVHLYGWHSRHHVAHITSLRARMGW
jgi:hypothetical protein